MDKNKKILIGAITAAVVVGGIAIVLILNQTPAKADLSTIHTEAASQIPEETLPSPTSAETETAAPTQSTPAADDITADIETYTSGKVSIQYPVVAHMAEPDKEVKVNALLKSNALSIIKANGINQDKDNLSIKCKILSMDHKRLTAVYTGSLTGDGSAYPVALFYTNTVNLPQVQNMGLEDFADAYTMAGYVLSNDVKFSGIASDVESAVMEYRSTLDLNTLTKLFEDGDFPLDSAAKWPGSFSYEKQGAIYFSMPVPHALGDYVIVSFNPPAK